MKVGDPAPDFSLKDQNGASVRLSEFVSKSAVVLYFYPKDHSAGCTAEACAFRDSYEAFKDAGAVVIGISSDSAESHQSFAANNQLPFVLLSDPDGAVHKLYGVGKVFGLIASRETFVIDQQGVLRYRFASQLNATRHVSEALKVLHALPAAA